MEPYAINGLDVGAGGDPYGLFAAGSPRYILGLLAQIVTVSIETNKIVGRLPRLSIPKER